MSVDRKTQRKGTIDHERFEKGTKTTYPNIPPRTRNFKLKKKLRGFARGVSLDTRPHPAKTDCSVTRLEGEA